MEKSACVRLQAGEGPRRRKACGLEHSPVRMGWVVQRATLHPEHLEAPGSELLPGEEVGRRTRPLVRPRK